MQWDEADGVTIRDSIRPSAETKSPSVVAITQSRHNVIPQSRNPVNNVIPKSRDNTLTLNVLPAVADDEASEEPDKKRGEVVRRYRWEHTNSGEACAYPLLQEIDTSSLVFKSLRRSQVHGLSFRPDRDHRRGQECRLFH